MPLFEGAAQMFRDLGNKAEWLNAKANYWTCRIGGNDVDDVEAAARELTSLKAVECDGRIARKLSMCLARLEERRGDIEGALVRVKEAIAVAESKPSLGRFLEEDKEYLKLLMVARSRDSGGKGDDT